MIIIIFKKNGQLCNNIWSYVNVLAINENVDKIYIFGFDDYTMYFENLDSNPKIVFVTILRQISQNKIFWKCYCKSLTILNNILKPISNQIFTIEDGWSISNDDKDYSKTDFRIKILEIFKSKLWISDEALCFINQIKDPGSILIGIHIRRGDYKDFNNGKYYFDLSYYRNCMIKLESDVLQNLNKKTKFLIVSNEMIDLDEFFGLDVSKSLFRTPMHDIICLSFCDYINGPISSFSMWAAYYGNVPIHFMFNNVDEYTIADFKRLKSMSRFTDDTWYDECI